MSFIPSFPKASIYSFLEQVTPQVLAEFLSPKDQHKVYSLNKTINALLVQNSKKDEDRFFRGTHSFFFSIKPKEFPFIDSKGSFKVFVNQTGAPILYARLSKLHERLPFLNQTEIVILYDDFEEVSKKLWIEATGLRQILSGIDDSIKKIRSCKQLNEADNSSEEEDVDSPALSFFLARARNNLDLPRYFELLEDLSNNDEDKFNTLSILASEKTNTVERLRQLHQSLRNFGQVADDLPYLIQDKVCFFSKDFLSSINYQLNNLSLVEGNNYPKRFALIKRSNVQLNPDDAIVLSQKSKTVLLARTQEKQIPLRALSSRDLFVNLNISIEKLFKVNCAIMHPKNSQNWELFEQRSALANSYAYLHQELKNRGLSIKQAHLFLHSEDLRRLSPTIQRNFNFKVQQMYELQSHQGFNTQNPNHKKAFETLRKDMKKLKEDYDAQVENRENSNYYDNTLRFKAYNTLFQVAGVRQPVLEPALIPALASLDAIEQREKAAFYANKRAGVAAKANTHSSVTPHRATLRTPYEVRATTAPSITTSRQLIQSAQQAVPILEQKTAELQRGQVRIRTVQQVIHSSQSTTRSKSSKE